MAWTDSKLQDFRKAEARLTAAWQKLLDAVRASAPRRESDKARREYLDARAALEEHGKVHVEFALAKCVREDRERRGLPEQDYSVRDFFENYDPDNPDADYYRREREDAEEAERAVESSMLLGERFDRIIEGGIEVVGKILGGLFQVAGAIVLLWALIWLVKTLWYLS